MSAPQTARERAALLRSGSFPGVMLISDGDRLEAAIVAEIEAAERDAIERAANVAEDVGKTGNMLLIAGEMMAGEIRTAKALLKHIAQAIRSLP